MIYCSQDGRYFQAMNSRIDDSDCWHVFMNVHVFDSTTLYI